MTVLRALFLVSELAPLTGASPQAKEHNFLSRAIAELGVDVVVAVPGLQVSESARAGLARRLTPFQLSADQTGDEPLDVTVSEGSSASGRVQLLVIDLPPDVAEERAHGLFYKAALAVAGDHGQGLDAVFAGHGTEDALAAVTPAPADDTHAETAAPVRVFLLRDLTAPNVAAALERADRAVVSSTHRANELIAGVKSGRRDPASRLLKPFASKLRGVPAGIDTVEWNPRQDGLLDRDFVESPQAAKAAHKQRLRARLHLRGSDPSLPLLAVVGPIDDNVLTYGIANQLAQMPLQLAVVADREADAASLRYFTRIANQGPDRIAIRTFDDPDQRRNFVHELVAGADFFLIPRDSSAAGVSDLYGLAYGCAPIAPHVGGYADSLVEFDSLSGTGSGFLYRPYETDHLLDAVQRAINAHRRTDDFGKLIERAMNLDLSWRATAQRYVNIIVDVVYERRAKMQALAS